MSPEIRIRAFLAIELDDTVKAALSGIVDGLRRAEIGGLRLVEPDGVHLTLKFLGDMLETQVEPISSAVREAVDSIEPFVMLIGDPGVFPSRRRPRVLWVGLDGDLPHMTMLHQRLEDALVPLGFERESRLFRPHLTLGRLRERASDADRSRAAEALLSSDAARGTPVAVEAVSLMRSVLLPTGAEYGRLSHIPFGGSMA